MEVERLRFDIERLRNPTTRTAKQHELQSNFELEKKLDARFEAAQNAFVDRHLNLNPKLEPGLGYTNEDTYQKQLEKLQVAFRQTPEAIQMRDDHTDQIERSWTDLRVSVSKELRKQEHHHRR